MLDGGGECTDGHSGFLGHATNNVAEYNGLLEALNLADRAGAEHVELLSDSELIVKQINGQYRVRHPDLKPLFAKAKQRISGFAFFSIRHVRREHNKDADRLVNVALDEAEGQD